MFYVYDLIDPRTGAVFYVGKGRNNRMYEHEKEAQRGVRSRKCDRIREIVACGLVVQCKIVSEHDQEDDAYAAEAERILRIGLDKLTNVLPGGRGGRISGESCDRKRPSSEWERDLKTARHLQWLTHNFTETPIDVGTPEANVGSLDDWKDMARLVLQRAIECVGIERCREWVCANG